MSIDDKVYKIIELVGSSTKGFEDAVQVAAGEEDVADTSLARDHRLLAAMRTDRAD